MKVTQEMSIECFPTLDSMLGVRQRMAEMGETIAEWRVHPVGAYILGREVRRRAYTGSLSMQARVFGIPIIEDVSVKMRRCKVIVKREVTELREPVRRGLREDRH